MREMKVRNVSRVSSYSTIKHIVIVDNDSNDESYSKLIKLECEKIRVIKSERNGGYAYGNNIGIKYCIKNFSSQYILISNPDVIYNEECLIDCCNFLRAHNDFTIVAPRMKNINGEYVDCAWNLSGWFSYATSGLLFARKNRFLNDKNFQNTEFVPCDCVAGSFFIVDVNNFINIGFFDEKTFLYCEETIIGFKNGKQKAAVLSNSSFVHAHSVSINKTFSSELKRKKLLWESRIYVLRQYYKVNAFQLCICKIIMKISLAETWLKCVIKRK